MPDKFVSILPFTTQQLQFTQKSHGLNTTAFSTFSRINLPANPLTPAIIGLPVAAYSKIFPN